MEHESALAINFFAQSKAEVSLLQTFSLLSPGMTGETHLFAASKHGSCESEHTVVLKILYEKSISFRSCLSVSLEHKSAVAITFCAQTKAEVSLLQTFSLLSPGMTGETHLVAASEHGSWALVSEYAKIRAAKTSVSEFILFAGSRLLVSQRILVTTAETGNSLLK